MACTVVLGPVMEIGLQGTKDRLVSAFGLPVEVVYVELPFYLIESAGFSDEPSSIRVISLTYLQLELELERILCRDCIKLALATLRLASAHPSRYTCRSPRSHVVFIKLSKLLSSHLTTSY